MTSIEMLFYAVLYTCLIVYVGRYVAHLHALRRTRLPIQVRQRRTVASTTFCDSEGVYKDAVVMEVKYTDGTRNFKIHIT